MLLDLFIDFFEVVVDGLCFFLKMLKGLPLLIDTVLFKGAELSLS